MSIFEGIFKGHREKYKIAQDELRVAEQALETAKTAVKNKPEISSQEEGEISRLYDKKTKAESKLEVLMEGARNEADKLESKRSEFEEKARQSSDGASDAEYRFKKFEKEKLK